MDACARASEASGCCDASRSVASEPGEVDQSVSGSDRMECALDHREFDVNKGCPHLDLKPPHNCMHAGTCSLVRRLVLVGLPGEDVL